MNRKISSLSILIAIIFLFQACNQQNPLKEEQLTPKPAFWSNVWKVVQTVGADAGGAYIGAKMGMWYGGVLGPKGAALGGVIGACIVGCWASYNAGKSLSIAQTVPPYKLDDQDITGIDSNNISFDDVGVIHNNILKILLDNRESITNENGEHDNYAIYLLAMNFFEDTIGINNPENYFSYNNFCNLVNSFNEINTLEKLVDYLYINETNQTILDFLEYSLERFSYLETVEDFQSEVIDLKSEASNLNITNDEKNSIFSFLEIANRSVSFWATNQN
ncbi:MAG TPA: hypothetical protein PKY56_09565 [Candidatus Kapabacteria bacterium]|nr:hypothetical protein [Candidatus Kapabacteria bacterium]